MKMESFPVETKSKALFEPSVLVVIKGTEAFITWTSTNRTITQAEVENGAVLGFRQTKGQKTIKQAVFPKAGAGLLSWLKFFPGAIDVECISADPGGAIKFFQGIEIALGKTTPPPEESFTIGEA